MPCTLTIAARSFPCKTGIGGIKHIYVANYNSVTWDAIVSGAVAGVTGATSFYRISPTKNSGSLVQTITSSIENGTIFFSQLVTLNLPLLSAADNANLYELMKGRCAVIVHDSNDNLLIMGYSEGCEVSGGEITTGTAKGDMNGYSLQILAEEKLPAPHLAATAGDPTDTDITIVV
jgi:hypothetical protein